MKRTYLFLGLATEFLERTLKRYQQWIHCGHSQTSKNQTAKKNVTRLTKFFYPVLILAIMMQVTSCGTLLYPERRGRKSGQCCDPAVVIMDGIGVFFFIIPGLMAFVVDFYTGAIYLPDENSGINSSSSTADGLLMIENEPDELTLETIEGIVSKHSRRPIKLAPEEVRIYELENRTDIPSKIASAVNFHN